MQHHFYRGISWCQYTIHLRPIRYDFLARSPVSLALQEHDYDMTRFHHITSSVLLIAAALSCAGLWQVALYGNVFVMWAIGLVLMMTVATGYRFAASTTFRLTEHSFLLILMSATLLPRLWWISNAGTLPIADFAGYQDYALQVASGNLMGYTDVMTVFPFKFFYPMILGALYWLTTPSAYIAQLLNVVCSVIIAYQVYRLGSMAGGMHAGRLAAIFFALWPSQIAFCSVVAQEHLFQVFFLGGVILLLRAQESSSNRSVTWLGFFAGALIALAHVLRPVAMVIVPTIATVLLWGTRAQQHLRRYVTTVGASLALGFVIVAGLFMGLASTAVDQPLWKSNAGFSLYVGTSSESRGFWSVKHAAIIDEYAFDTEAIHEESTRRAVASIVEHPGDFVQLVATKFVLFWGSDDYGVYYSTVEQIPSASAVTIFRYRNRINLVAQGVYFFILAAAGIGLYRRRAKSNNVLLIIASVFLLHVAAFSLLEIQSRYHVLVVPLLMIPAAMTFTKRNSDVPA